MENKKTIQDELEMLSPLLAGLQQMNVFSLPVGYFDDFSIKMMGILNPLNVPGQEEDSVPAGYFENLSGSIMERIRSMESSAEEIRALSPVLYSVRQKNVFQVWQGYFDETVTGIFEKINKESDRTELEQLSPLLYGLQNKNVFEVPEGYFSDLPGNISKQLPTVAAKVVPLKARRTWLRVAVAAMMTGVIAFGVYKYTGGPNVVNPDSTAVVEIDSSIKMGIKMDDLQFSEAMQKLSTVDIVNYLEAHGDITDIAALRNQVDEDQLPDLDDYLINDKTLENYLTKIQISLNN